MTMKKLNPTLRQGTPWIPAILFLIGLGVLISCTKKVDDDSAGARLFVADSVYVQRGNLIVAGTFDTLRKSLFQAISSQNFEAAITFCREQAYPITATYADTVDIRRTALRVRNLNNRPDSLELAVLIEMGNQVQAAQTPDPKIVRKPSSGEIHFFKPILLQPMCLNCHGTPGQQIQNNTLARIQQLYPNDQAVNFREGDLRGIWHITFYADKE
jgi:hypothetical protein